MENKYHLDVETNCRLGSHHDPYYDFVNKRYPSLESAVKSAEFIVHQSNVVIEVGVFDGLDWICTVELGQPIAWRNGKPLL